MNIIIIVVIAILVLVVVVAFLVLRQSPDVQIDDLRQRAAAAAENDERSTFSQRVPGPNLADSASGEEAPRIMRWGDQADTAEPPATAGPEQMQRMRWTDTPMANDAPGDTDNSFFSLPISPNNRNTTDSKPEPQDGSSHEQ